MEIESKEDISSAEAFKHLSEMDEDELNTVQKECLEHMRTNLKVKDVESFKNLVEELEEIDSLKDNQIIKLLEILPTHEKEVRTIMSKERIKLEDDEIDQIISICKSYEA